MTAYDTCSLLGLRVKDGKALNVKRGSARPFTREFLKMNITKTVHSERIVRLCCGPGAKGTGGIQANYLEGGGGHMPWAANVDNCGAEAGSLPYSMPELWEMIQKEAILFFLSPGGPQGLIYLLSAKRKAGEAVAGDTPTSSRFRCS